ncbi:hypothetical protein [Xenorhabdus innexi]|uniref:Uncharacterized protein n=1 Tax=Xenorhabdus innexi TaxID=290109 RepID=A0A1N6N018_9GAMM|nr:hypothetical protein [Xenorhabdus innexi]PHM37724.1 hypothetical protein Xinn_00822 [Xenorhabdus innexi]SIP74441.1 hypothetical protein XIS1_640003 [Xenorhabdus innexi]
MQTSELLVDAGESSRSAQYIQADIRSLNQDWIAAGLSGSPDALIRKFLRVHYPGLSIDSIGVRDIFDFYNQHLFI